MRVIYGIKKIRRFKRPVLALGVFDGVHRGHINILKAAVRQAHKINGESVVITFCPDPHREEGLYSLAHRLRLICSLGIDVCVVINFNKRFARIPAEDFIMKILVKAAGASYVYIGKNFRFGRGAKGGAGLLKRFAARYGFRVRAFNMLRKNGRPISSTHIRALIKKGNLKEAERLLSRPVTVLGTVIKGISLARRLGFPTANIDPHQEITPPPGIYAVRLVYHNENFYGVCYIGNKPTLKIKKGRHIEVHIFNFSRKIYRKYLEIQFVKKIRNDKKFASVQLLAEQIKKDIQMACLLFGLSKRTPQHMP